jgi:hypothetical protein
MAQHIPIIIILSIEGRESKQADEKLYCQITAVPCYLKTKPTTSLFAHKAKQVDEDAILTYPNYYT